MQEPPFFGSPTEMVPPGTRNPGSESVRVGWDGLRYFYGTVINQAWNDLEVVGGLGVVIV